MNGIYYSVQKLELTMHYTFRKYGFNILSSLCIYNIGHLNNHKILFFQFHKLLQTKAGTVAYQNIQDN